MMQLGNLAIVAAKHKDCMLQIFDNGVSVHTGTGNERKTIGDARPVLRGNYR